MFCLRQNRAHTKNTASTDVWAVQRVIAAMSGSLSTQQLAELLPAKLLVFGLVGAALDSAVNDIAPTHRSKLPC